MEESVEIGLNVEIRTVGQVDRDEFIRLYIDGGWWDDDYYSDTSFIDKIVAGSEVFAGAFDNNGNMTGMGRAISDGCSDAYIQDVVVLKQHRNKGIGGMIIKFIVCELRKRGIDWIGLVAEPRSEKFYKNLGFKKMKNHIPMILEQP